MTDTIKDHLLEPIPEESSYPKYISSSLDRTQDSVASVDTSCTNRDWSFSLDDTPIQPAIDGQKLKSFEELVEEALRREESSANLENPSKPKKPFLKKGSGLTRFKPREDAMIQSHRKSCRKRLEEQFQDQPITKTVSRSFKKNEDSKSNGAKSGEEIQVKKITLKIAPHRLKPVRSSLKEAQRRCSQPLPSKNQTDTTQGKKMVKSKSSEILSRYSSDFECIPRIDRKLDRVVTHEALSKVNTDGQSQKSPTKSKKVNFHDESRVQVLERLLESIKAKQSELRKEALDSESDEDSWQDESSGSEEELMDKRSRYSSRERNNSKGSRRSSLEPSKSLSSREESDSGILAEPRISNYTKALKNKIETLQDRLKDLSLKCQKNSEEYKSRRNSKISSKPTSQKVTEERILGEMDEIKKQILLLFNKFDTLETRLISKESPSPKLNGSKNQGKVLASPEVSLHARIQELETGTHLTLDNGDQIMKATDNTIIYNYASGVKQITHPDGTKVVEFPSGQIERIAINGTKTIFYPNNTERIIRPNGSEETITPDGTVIRITIEGTEIIELSNGEREIRTKEFKRREYLDGTVKTIHADGTEETRYPNGRLRIKDKDGKLVADSILKRLS